MKIIAKLIILFIALLITFGSIQSAFAQIPSSEALTYKTFGELLTKTMEIELPEGAELLPDAEYYEVMANIFAEKGVGNFKKNAPDAVVTRAGMADVLYTLSGAREELGPDEKIDYLIENGYMPEAYLNSEVTFVEGDVLILKSATRKWQQASPGDSLQDGDKVKTPTGARVKLQFGSGGKIILKEHTTVTISKADSNGPGKGGSTELYLSQGEIKALVKRLEGGSTFEVKTPTAVCGIRGTTYYLKVDEEDNAGVFVEKGGVDFSSPISEQSQNVGANKTSLADTKGNVIEPHGLSPEDIKKWMLGYENIQNSIPISHNEGTQILSNPGLAGAIAEPYSEPAPAAAAVLGLPGPDTEGPVEERDPAITEI